MWPSGRGLVPYPAALPLPQNSTVYNPGGNPELRNQQGTIFTNYARYPHYAPYWAQARPAPYSQQVSGAPLSQDQMVLRDQNWLFQNRNRRESMLEYQNGEVVMVRCNQQKWLYGTIKRMSAQGLRIWIADANILVNVPLVLVPTHVLKMSMYSELQALPPPEPMWTMAITDKNGCRKALVQCVRPAHLSHRQLFHKFGCVECAICKTTVSSIDVVSPWNCSHQVHNYCLQLRMQHSSTSVCPSCNEMGTSQRMPVPFSGENSTLQLVPSTFAGIWRSTSQLMPSPSTSNALVSPSNEQHQQWLDLQCACGFRGSIDSVCIGNVNAPVFCPNCHKPVNINPMMIGIRSGERFASMNFPRAYSEVDKEILRSKSLQEQGFGWPMQSFSGPSRLEAIEEGSGEGICSTPPSPDQTGKEHIEASCLPSFLVAFGDTFENMFDPDAVAVSFIDRNMQPSPSSRSVWDGVPTAPSPTQVTLNQKGNSSARSFLQDGVLTAASPTEVTQIQNGHSSARRSLQDRVLTTPSRTQVTENEQSSARGSLLEIAAPSPTQITPIQNGKSSARITLQDGSMDAPSSGRITLLQDEESTNNAPRPKEFLIGPAASTHVNHVKFPVGQEANESSEEALEAETPSLLARHRQKLWRRATEVNWMRSFDEDSGESEEASSSNDFAATAPSTPPVYVNHFENFVKLAMASASTAKGILASISASPSSPTSDLPPSRSPTPALVTPAPAFVTPAPAFVTPAPAFVTPAPAFVTPAPAFVTTAPASVTPAPAIVIPAASFFTRDPALITEASAVVTPARAFISRAPALMIEPPAFVSEPPASVKEGAIIAPSRALLSRAAGLITQPPAWVSKVKDPNGSGPSGEGTPAWITVIKDGVDSRREDARQWELDRLARKKEAEFF